MENATEALKIAFGFMMFVLALSLSMFSFSQATQAVESITTLKDRETQYTYVEPASDSNRIVGAETIIPTMYKAYKENFRIEFYDGTAGGNYTDHPIYLYRYIDPNGVITDVNYVDLEEEILPSAAEAINHLTILLGDKTYAKKYQEQFYYHPEGLYKYFSNRKFKETLGEYYQEDKNALESGTQSEGLNINKTKKRIITYILQN